MRAVFCLGCILMLLCLSACGSGAGLSGSDSLAGSSADEKSELFAAAPEAIKGSLPPQPEFSGLPALSELAALGRSASVTGPGWLNIDPGSTVRSHKTGLHADGHLAFEPDTSPAFALYGAFGFDGDNFPTSLRVTLEAPPSGPYYVGFSDFVAGRWVYAGPFNGDSEAELPNVAPYNDPSAYCSANGTHYFVIVAPGGSGCIVSQLELGVSGGDNPPLPPLGGVALSGDAGTIFLIQPSPSAADPDFAGYMIERAPALSGPFSPVNNEPFNGLQYFDPDTDPGVGYRWRVAAVDTSGNQSLWATTAPDFSFGTNLQPVVRARLPYGKHYGPYSFTLDLSECFDPDGDEITSYRVATPYGLAPITSASPLIPLTLQPGCHRLSIRLTDSGGHNGFASLDLKVYPRWADSSALVRSPISDVPTNFPRLYKSQVQRNPATGLLTIAGYDISQSMYSVYQELSDGSFAQTWLPACAPVLDGGEARFINGAFMLPVASEATVLLLRWDPAANNGKGGGEFTDLASGSLTSPAEPPFYHCSIASDGAGHGWAFYTVEDTPDIKLVARQFGVPMSPMSLEQDLLPSIVNLDELDAEYNPASGKIELVISTPAGISNYEFDPLTATLGPAIPVYANPASNDGLDLEINPVSGRAGLVFRSTVPTTRCRYTEKDALGVWSAAHIVDDSAANGEPSRLEYDPSGTALVLFREEASKQLRLFTTTTSSSSQVCAPPELISEYGFCQLSADNSTQMLGICENANNTINLVAFNIDGSVSTLRQIASVEGQSRSLQAALSDSDIHVLWTSLVAYTGHSQSSDGSSWTALANEAYVPYFDIGGGADGKLLITASTLAGQLLSYWDTGTSSFAGAMPLVPGQVEHHPVVSDDPLSTQHIWMHYDDTDPLNMQFASGTVGSFSTYTTPHELLPLWDGAVSGPDSSFGDFYTFTNAGGLIDASGGYLSWSENGTNNDWVCPPQGNLPNSPLCSDVVRGQCFAVAHFQLPTINGLGFGIDSDNLVFYSAMGDTTSPQRYRYPDLDGDHTSIIPFGEDFNNFYQVELRRTVSAYTVQGPTAVAVITSMDGHKQYMEWSDYGRFEELPMPSGLGLINNAVITATPDGRWHMIYHDPQTDEILCRSTL